MFWHQISVVANQEVAPKVADVFGELGAVSVTYMDAADEPVYEPAVGETVIWSRTRIIALYEKTIDPVHIKSLIRKHLSQECLNFWEFDIIQDQAWERAWMKYYQPMKFADKLWVCPTGQEQHEENTVRLILDPGLAFGTGTHPTTALCLEWLASHEISGKTVVDYGCGSGILAIAALLLGAAKAYAIDCDPQAITATEDNAVKNKVRSKINACLPEQFDLSGSQADVVVANILTKPLLEMSSKLSSLLATGGQLVLSGILTEQVESIVSGFKPYILLDSCVCQEGWVRLAGIKQ